MKTLKQRLKGELKNFYLFQGEDFFLYDRGFAMIKKACNINFEDFNLQKFDDENFSAKSVIDSLEMLPMADERRLVLVKNVAKISENDKKTFFNYLSSPSDSSVLVIFDYFKKFDFLKDYAEFVDCKRFDYPLCKALIISEFEKNGKKISEEAVSTLFDSTNGYLSKIINEVSKISAYASDEELITKQMIDNLTSKDYEYIVYQLTEALGSKNADLAINLLNQMAKEQGLISLITNHFRRLFFISISDLDNKELASLLGVKEYAITKQRAQAKNFSKIQLKKIYSLLEEVDFNIKNGQMLQDTALNYIVFSILNI